MAIDSRVLEVLTTAADLERLIGFADSDPDPLESNGSRTQQRIEALRRHHGELMPSIDAAAAAFPNMAEKLLWLRGTVADSIHLRAPIGDIAAARRAVEVAAYQAAPATNGTPTENRQTDMKTDSGKKPTKKRQMNSAAVDCCRRYREARRADPTITMKQVVSEYVEGQGGSESSLNRILNDNPDQWRIG